MQLSIVTTMYRSAGYLREFHARTKRCATAITPEYEIVLVNDGSPDDSLSLAVALQGEDAHVRIVDLSRNFGHHRAIMAGLAYARGDLVFLVDCDLEESPEWLAEFYAAMCSAKAPVDVVFGVQEQRRGGWTDVVSGWLYYRVANFLSDVKIPTNLVTARLMTRRYVDALLQFQEREMVISGLWVLAGFTQQSMSVRKERLAPSNYSLGRKLTYAIRSSTLFSRRPLIAIAVVGAIILGISIVYILYLLAVAILFGQPPQGYTSLIVSVWFLGGLTVFSVGIVAVYLATVFSEVKQRPTYIVRQLYEPIKEGSQRMPAGSSSPALNGSSMDSSGSAVSHSSHEI